MKTTACRSFHNLKLPTYLLILHLSIMQQTTAGEMRAWNYTRPGGDSTKFEAELVGIEGVTVLLKGKDGKSYRTPLAHLSAPDNQYVEKISQCDADKYLEWTDSFGNMLEVRYTGIADQMVVLNTKDGGGLRVPWSNLNVDQQKFVVNAQRTAWEARVTAIEEARQWSPIAQGIQVATINGMELANEDKKVRMLMFSPDRALLYAEQKDRASIWSVSDLRHQCRLECYPAYSSVFFDGSGRQVWELYGERLTRMDAISGRLLGGRHIEWIENWKESPRLREQLDGQLQSMQFSGDGKILAVSLIRQDRPNVYLLDPVTGDIKEALAGVQEGHYVSRLRFSPDGKTLVGEYDEWKYVWNLVTKHNRACETSHLLGLIDKGELWGFLEHERKQVGIYRTGSGETVGTFTIPDGRPSRYSDVAISPLGTRLAVVRKNEIILYDWASGTEVAILAHHAAPVTAIEYSADGSLLASGDEMGTIKLWKFVSSENGMDVEESTPKGKDAAADQGIEKR